jgi:hypothetical protein
VSVSHPPQRRGHVVVAYRDFMRLRIPVQATNLAADIGSQLRTQFTREAILDLLALLKECEDPCSVIQESLAQIPRTHEAADHPGIHHPVQGSPS